MAINHQSSFNSGELSRKMDGRSDLAVYKNGCSFLENFFVLPQGGAERRTGTQFIDYTNEDDAAEGDTSVRMIPFIFSADEAYACEFGDGYIKVWSSDGTNVDVTGTVPYAEADLSEISFDQRFDVMFLAHPDHPVQTLSRTSTTPTFEIAELEYEYPPFLDQNLDSRSTVRIRYPDWTAGTYYQNDYSFYQGAHYQVAVASTTNSPPHADWNVVIEDEVVFEVGEPVNILSVEDVFTNEMDGAFFRIRHPLSSEKRLLQGRLDSNGETSAVVYLGTGSQFAYRIRNDRQGGGGNSTCVIESNTLADFSGTNNVELTLNSDGIFNGYITPTYPYVRIRKTNALENTSFLLNRNTNRRITNLPSGFGSSDTTDALDVSFSQWKVITEGTWNGSVEIERSTDNQESWETFVSLGDTTNLNADNFTYSSSSTEGKTTFIRVKYVHSSGTMKVVISNESLYSEGIIQFDSYNSATSYDATVINRISSGGSTSLWSEGAFSARRGYARATRFHQDRFWLAGSNFDTATVYGSVSGDYYNFITGTESDLGIKRVIDTSEDIKWLIGKKFLFAGTTGGAIQITSADQKENVTADNIQTNPQSVFGASSIQGILANDVIVYPQRNNLKLRDMIYNWEEENFRSNDLTILNDEILSGVVKEVFLQKQPDQIVWCVMENGQAAILTYERQQEVVGWSRVKTDGEIISGCSLPTSGGEDEVWLCVKRLGKYLIEKFRPRQDLEWYVDSAVEFDGGACVSADSIDVSDAQGLKVIITDADNSVSDGDKIRFENVVGLPALNNKVFTVADRTASDFVLKTEDGLDYINYFLFDTFSVLTSDSGTFDSENHSFDRIVGGRPHFVSDASLNRTIVYDVDRFEIRSKTASIYENITSNGIPPKTGWVKTTKGDDPPPTLSYYLSWENSLSGDYCVVKNSLSGLDHLEGETVQVVADGVYAQDATVSSGSVTLDDYANTIIVGLGVDSTLRTMPLEPILANRLPQSRQKAAAKATVKFYKTIGAKINEQGKPPNTFPALKVGDESGQPIELKTGETKFFISSDWEREKIIEIKQDLPYPMTVLSMAVWVEVKGG